jgi:hypothetical protein
MENTFKKFGSFTILKVICCKLEKLKSSFLVGSSGIRSDNITL